MGDTVPFETAEAWGAKVLRPLRDMDMATRTLVNINFPALPAPEVKGIRVTRQGFHDYGRGSIFAAPDPRGYRHYLFVMHVLHNRLRHPSEPQQTQARTNSATPLTLHQPHAPPPDPPPGR